MTRRRRRVPKGSEIPAGEWLAQIGATCVEYTGADGSPPDYVINYQGDTVAVEVTRLTDKAGWPKHFEMSVSRELERITNEVYAEVEDPPRWHVWCEYDPAQPKGSMKDGAWKDRARAVLRRPGPGGEFQLLPPERVRRRGVNLILCPASNEGSLHDVCMDMGGMVLQPLIDRITAAVEKKTRLAQRASQSHDHWWLVLDDEILMVPFSVLSPDEQDEIEEAVRSCDGRRQWSKIVLVSRFAWASAPSKPEKWFHALWQDGLGRPLPASPQLMIPRGL